MSKILVDDITLSSESIRSRDFMVAGINNYNKYGIIPIRSKIISSNVR